MYSAGHGPKSHEGVLHLISLHFVKTGKLEVSAGRALARLQKYRGEADYGEGFVVDSKPAAEDIAAAKELCERLRGLLPVDSTD